MSSLDTAMRYVQLRAFHYVAICGGFSRAAEALHLTQPAISDQVRKLEAEYDLRLFDRNKKQVSLTDQGKKLIELTHRLFEVEQKALEFLSASQTLKTGSLTIIADSPHHILHILAPFREKYPHIRISIQGGNSVTVLEKLNSYQADIGVMGDIPENQEFQVTKLSSTPLIAFAPVDSEMAKLKSVRVRDLATMPLVLREAGSKTRSKFEELAAQNKLTLQTPIEAEGREAVREIVASGGGIGIVSEAEFGQDSRLKKIPISDSNLTMDEAVVTLKERQDSKLIRAFLQFVKPAGL